MRRAAVASLLCLAVVVLACQPATAGHVVYAVSATANTPVPAAADYPANEGESACAESLHEALTSGFEMEIVQASQLWSSGVPVHVYTLVGKGKRTLILICLSSGFVIS